MRKLKIVIPMAGRGSRFKRVGYESPKPYIEFLGKKMIQHVIDNLNTVTNRDVEFIFIGLSDQKEYFENIKDNLKVKYKTVWLDAVTGGSCETVLKAKEYMKLAGYDVDLLNVEPETAAIPLDAYLLPITGSLIVGVILGAGAIYLTKGRAKTPSKK